MLRQVMMVLIAATSFVSAMLPVAAQTTPTDFYRGKTLTISVGLGAGGGYDLYARVVARHLGRHIPGEPAVIVRNVPGAGGIVLANMLYNVTAKDGLEIGTINRTLLLDPLLGNAQAQFDPLKFAWLGSPANETSTCLAYHTSDIKTVADLKQRELVMGAPGPTTDSAMYARLANTVLGTRFRTITGYPGSSDAILAMERGETQGFCGWSYSSMESVRPGWLAQGRVRVLLQFGMSRNPVFGDVPLVQELVGSELDRQLVELIVAPQLFARPFFGPPGLPPERAATLKAAFAATIADPLFLADAKERRLDISYVSGDDVLAALKRAYVASPDAVAQAKLITNGQ